MNTAEQLALSARIAEWIGLHQEPLLEDPIVFCWVDAKGHFVAKVSDFNPLASPSDCNLVMDEVIRDGNRIVRLTITKDLAVATIQEIGLTSRGKGKTECEAKMNALLEAISH